MKRVCVFCGSSDSVFEGYLQAAWQLGDALSRRGLDLVYGGGSTGLMGSLANAVIETGGQVTGVIPELFHRPELAHQGLTRLEVVPTMHQRKARMVELADAFVALPGGYGTLEELFEVLTWAQVGLHRKPIGLLNTGGYFDPLLALIAHLRSEGFIYAEHDGLFTQAHEPDGLLDALAGYQPPDGLERWLNRDA